MEKSIINKQSDTISIIQELKDNELLNVIEESLVVSLLQNFSEETLYRISLDLLTNYEDDYIKSVNTFLVREYKINITNLENLNTETIDHLEKLKSNYLVQFLISFQSTFNNLKKYLKVENIESLSRLKKIISLYALNDEGISKDNYLELISEIPHMLSKNLQKSNLLSSFNINMQIIHGLQVQPYEDDDRYGVNLYKLKDNRQIPLSLDV